MATPPKAGKGPMSRRQLLKTASLGAAVAAMSTAPRAAADEPTLVDVVVVGAGTAGSMAARELVNAGKSVALIEANDRIGGRLKGGEIAGQVIDLGGMWVGPQQSYALKIAEELGLTKFPMHLEGDGVGIVGGETYKFKTNNLPLPGEALMDLGTAFAKMNNAAKNVPTRSPWTAPEAKAWDSITVDTWIEQNAKHPATKEILRFIIEAVCSVEATQISFLQWLFYIHSGEKIEVLTGTVGGAQQDLYVEGFHQIPVRLAQSLGGHVVLGSPVRAIEQDESGVTVRSEKGTWRAQHVIVTVPPYMTTRIDFSPELPYKRRGLMQRMPMGTVIKCFVAYEAPFWRDEGLSGECYNTAADFGLFYDITQPGKTHGVLSGFFDGGPAQAWSDRTEDERRERVIEDISKLLGKNAKKPIEYVEQNWPQEPWSIGGYTSIPAPGVLTHFGEALTEPCGRIHWSGTETAERWSGYVEGALRSGERAAKDVLARL